MIYEGKQREMRRESFREGRHGRIGEGTRCIEESGIVSRSSKKRIVEVGFSVWDRILLFPFFFPRIWSGFSIPGI